jgi:hypothetical protein
VTLRNLKDPVVVVEAGADGLIIIGQLFAGVTGGLDMGAGAISSSGIDRHHRGRRRADSQVRREHLSARCEGEGRHDSGSDRFDGRIANKCAAAASSSTEAAGTMGAKVTVNSPNTVVHASSSGKSPVFPDVCKTPAPPAPPIPIRIQHRPIVVSVRHLDDRLRGRQKIMLKKSVFSTSSGDEPARSAAWCRTARRARRSSSPTRSTSRPRAETYRGTST